MAIEGVTVRDEHVGRRVRYVPGHAHGDLGHGDVEDGVITSFNEKFVFVRYGTTGNGQATDPGDLRWG